MLSAEMRAGARSAAGSAAHAAASCARRRACTPRRCGWSSRALQAARRWAEIPPLLEQLVRRKVFDARAGASTCASARTASSSKRAAHDAAGLRDYWARAARVDQLHPKVARAAARELPAARRRPRGRRHPRREPRSRVGLGAGRALRRMPPRRRDASARAGRALAVHAQPGRGAAARARRRCASAQQLWGKAQTYLEASLALDDGWRAHLALGEMLGRLGRDGEANAHFVAALKLATDELSEAERALAPDDGVVAITRASLPALPFARRR